MEDFLGDDNNEGRERNHERERRRQHSGPGVLLRTIKPGNTQHRPVKGDRVKVHYEAFLAKNLKKPFDSSRERNITFTFVLGKRQVIEGWEVAVASMCIGQLAEVTIPHYFAYGDEGYPPIVPPKSTLVFRIELLDILENQPNDN